MTQQGERRKDLCDWLRSRRQPTPQMLAAGWRQLKRDHLPRLGAGPGLSEAFGAMVDQLIEEISK